MATVIGSELLARALKSQGVETMFYVMGGPMLETEAICINLGMQAFQEIDQVAVMRPVTKWAERIYDARRIPDMVATAFRQATTGRPGPVYLDLPGDILGEKVDDEKIEFPPAWKTLPRPLGD